MINAIVCDSNTSALEKISEHINEAGGITLLKTFSSFQDALKYALKFPVDLFITETVNTGYQMSQLGNISDRIKIVLTSNSGDHAVEAFNINAADYLLRPFNGTRFIEAMEKVKVFYDNKLKAGNPEDYFYIRADYSLIKVFYKDILFIEGLDDYLKIHLTSGKIIVARCTLKSISEKLKAKNFIRVHRSFIIPLQRVSKIQKRRLAIEDNIIPIGNRYVDSFFSAFQVSATA